MTVRIPTGPDQLLRPPSETRNAINDERSGEYHNVVEYINVAHPTPDTLAKIAALKPSTETNGDGKFGLIYIYIN